MPNLTSPYPIPRYYEKFSAFFGVSPLTYTDWFIVVTCFLAIMTLVVCLLRDRRIHICDSIGYWVYGAIYISFAAFRPLGVSVDDVGYLPKFNNLCPILECSSIKEFFRRDGLWFAVISILKEVHPYPQVMLWLSAFSLFAKLAVIYSLSDRKMLALYVYVSIFYLVDDITALRASFSAVFFTIAFWSITRGMKWFPFSMIIASGLAHIQGFISLALLLGRHVVDRKNIVIFMIIMPIILVAIGVHPTDGFAKLVNSIPFLKVAVNPSGMGAYVFNKNLEVKTYGTRSVPLVMPPLLFLLAYIYNLPKENRRGIDAYAAYSVGLSSIIIWFYAFSPTVQFRLSNIFLLPSAVLVSNLARNNLMIFASLFVITLFNFKYNVIHTTIFDSSRVKVQSVGGGHVEIGYVQVCDFNCIMDLDNVAITAIPDEGYVFSEWSGGCSGGKPICHLGAYQAVDVTAIFTVVPDPEEIIIK